MVCMADFVHTVLVIVWIIITHTEQGGSPGVYIIDRYDEPHIIKKMA